MSEKILSVKLLKKGEKVEVRTSNASLVNSENTILYKDACHPDLYNALQETKSHLALLTDYIPIGGDIDAVALAPFEVTGYSLNSKQDGVTLKGYRETDLGRTVTLNVLVKFQQDEANGYPLIRDLEMKIQKIESETDKYRLEGKTLQVKMDFDEKEAIVTHAQVAEPDELAKFKTKEEWSAEEYSNEVDKTTQLRDQGKVVPIKKEKKVADKKSSPKKTAVK